MRRVYKVVRKPDEPWSAFVRRHMSEAKSMFHQSGGASLLAEFLKKHYMFVHRTMVQTGVTLLSVLNLVAWPDTAFLEQLLASQTGHHPQPGFLE